MRKCKLKPMPLVGHIDVETIFSRTQQRAEDAFYINNVVDYLIKETDISNDITDKLYQISNRIFNFKNTPARKVCLN